MRIGESRSWCKRGNLRKVLNRCWLGFFRFSFAQRENKVYLEVKQSVAPRQQPLPGMDSAPNSASIVVKTAQLVVPKGEVTTSVHPFVLDCSSINYPPVEQDLLIQHLRTYEQETVSFGGGIQPEQRLDDYVVRGFIDFDDISYDEHSDLLDGLTGQLVTHLKWALTGEAIHRG